jgi:hypothetical protein
MLADFGIGFLIGAGGSIGLVAIIVFVAFARGMSR